MPPGRPRSTACGPSDDAVPSVEGGLHPREHRGLGPLFRTTRSRILARVALYSVTVFGALPLALSQSIIGTVRQPASHPPLGFEEAWAAVDGLRLRAWISRGDGKRAAAIVVHGLGDTLESYLEVAWVLGRRGHTVLLLDLRGHGGSEGRYTTLGGREREDVRAGMRLLRERGLAPSGFLLMGYSMGAVAVLRAAAEEADVRAVIAEAPFDRARGMPQGRLWLVGPLAIAMAEWRAGFDIDDVDAVAASRRVRAPLLAVVDGKDEGNTETVVRPIFEAHPGPKKLWVAPGADHVGAILAPGYWPTVEGFLKDCGI